MKAEDSISTKCSIMETLIKSPPTEEALAEASFMDRVEYGITQLPPVEVPLVHLFTPGLYARQMSVPAGTLITSMQHKTEHPFILLQGALDVISDTERIHYKAPCMGVTLPGTKRLAYIHEDVVWITFHANPADMTDPDQIVEDICVPFSNPLLSKDDDRVEIWRKSQSVKMISETIQQEKLLS